MTMMTVRLVPLLLSRAISHGSLPVNKDDEEGEGEEGVV